MGKKQGVMNIQGNNLGPDYRRQAHSVNGLARQMSQLTSMVYST